MASSFGALREPIRRKALRFSAVATRSRGKRVPRADRGHEHLDHTEITDEGLKPLASLPSLEILDLKGTSITDAGLVEVGRLNRLKGLYLTRTGITDAGLEHLRSV